MFNDSLKEGLADWCLRNDFEGVNIGGKRIALRALLKNVKLETRVIIIEEAQELRPKTNKDDDIEFYYKGVSGTETGCILEQVNKAKKVIDEMSKQ